MLPNAITATLILPPRRGWERAGVRVREGARSRRFPSTFPGTLWVRERGLFAWVEGMRHRDYEQKHEAFTCWMWFTLVRSGRLRYGLASSGMKILGEEMPSKGKITITGDQTLVRELEGASYQRLSPLERELKKGYQAMAKEDRATAERNLAAGWEALK